MTITRPTLRYHGGKFRMAPWIISHFPAHTVYVEPFGGAASVLLLKQPIEAEVYNDLDGRLVSLFRILRDPSTAAELRRRCETTLFSRAEFDWAYRPSTDSIDDAHKMIILSFMGHGTDAVTRSCRTGFRTKLTGARATPAASWRDWPSSIPEFCRRLRGVVIEQCDAIELMRRFDRPSTLHYLDPPYVHATRSAMSKGRGKTHGYRHEMTDTDHLRMLDAARDLAGMVVISGYPSDMYERSLQGWRRVERAALADGARVRTEVLWLNPACTRALETGMQGELLMEAAE